MSQSSGPLKKPHLPSAGLRASLRSDAIRLSYAQLDDEGIFQIRLMLLVPRTGPSRDPQTGGYDSCAQSPLSGVLLKYASARRFFARLASEIFLSSPRAEFFSTLLAIEGSKLDYSELSAGNYEVINRWRNKNNGK